MPFNLYIAPHIYTLFVFSLPQVNGTFRPLSQDLIWANLLLPCSFSLKTTKTEELTCLKDAVEGKCDSAIVVAVSLLSIN